MVFLRASGRFQVQVSVLTGQGVMGNYNMHTTVKVVHNGKVYEVPALTGNALKHWHSVHAAKAYEALGGKQLNEFCRKGVGLRGKDMNGNDADSESVAIEDFCNDLHGFLIPKKQIKRDSLVKFAFGIPVLTPEVLESVSKFAVTHNRVDPTQKGQTGEMMVFRQEYASGYLYGFAVSMDLDYLMTPIYESLKEGGSSNKSVDAAEKARRAKAAFAGLISTVTGGYGSKAARALPISSLKEMVVALSPKPIPQLVHGAYDNYIEKSIDVLKAYLAIVGGNAHVICYGVTCPEAERSAGKAEKSGANIEVKNVDKLEELASTVLDLIKKYIEETPETKK
ncbi:type I-A CRISPR-associated protein Cas7/Csa2 [Pyrobaculum aerophilum]|uniref:Type I-A CRISPR-associated protein Cas7/Csa2 n=1 Tax=Pyrobaculum aerophilum TaxID=13773 RepID=A0A371QUF0_9CREN|nr:type I-A CRISPR-associated protein Cas7/Csa2 [Pyrobaculum aerophilum]RFA93078.1 type I-A CRISPR-associated protein Cas7/Csa2 [Pyrobaculum aerophilum]RFA99172.1 type I-A CRISPR-associated protein Cas7/Csa2 [Pyrobaculum aerophilum]